MSPTRTFAIESVGFEGPLELLLDLIERRKLLINDVSLASVTDEYIKYVRDLETHPVHETSHFVALASTLLLIKSKSLLPILTLSEEEEGNIEELEHRLKLFQLFRDASRELAQRFGETVLYEKVYVPLSDPLFTPDKRTTLEGLGEAMTDVLKRLEFKPFKATTVVKKTVSLEDMIVRLEDRIRNQFKMSFRDFTSSGEKGDVIIGFLAVLELMKQGLLIARQENHFEDIHLEKEDTGTPRYS